MHPMRQSKRWRAFAILMLIAVIPFEFGGLFRHPSAYDAARYLVDTVSVIGVTGYAFGRPMGPVLLWRAFAPLFALFTVAIIFTGIPRFAAMLAASPHPGGMLLADAILLPLLMMMPWFTGLALFRHGGWLRLPQSGPSDLRATFS